MSSDGDFMPETILTYWSPEHPCIYCGSTTNTGHISSCQDAYLYDWRGVSIPAVPKPVPTWYELKVVFQASDIISHDQLRLTTVTDIAWALVKELSKYGVESSLVSSAELEPVSLRRV